MLAPDRRMPSTLALVAILVSVSAINPLAINIFVPAMPSIMRGLDTDFASVQLALSSYLFATAVAQLVLGPLSDRLGRRPVLLGGLAVFVVASAICTLAPNAAVLIAARVLQGIGGCVGIVLGRAIIRDRYDRDRAASMLGYVTMAFAVAPMVGPLIGGIMADHFGWRSTFGLLTGLGIIVAGVTWFALPETRHPSAPGADPVTFRQSFLTLIRIPAFWAYAFTCALGTSVFFAFLGGTPFIASELMGLTGTEYGLYFVLVSVGFMAGNFLTARFARRVGIHFMILAGSIVMLAAVIGMAIAFAFGADHPFALFAPMYGVGFANGLVLANAIAGAVSVRPELAGAASGLAGSLQIGFGAVTTVITSTLLGATHSPLALALAMVLLALAGVASARWTKYART